MEFAREGNFTSALECYRQGLECYPENIDAMVASGAALANLKQYDRAMKFFDDALGEVAIFPQG